ncbi:hypothetical protein PGT21_003267 [Puccinia graminis f. sp. tritici]|uniref:Uncharacterized protein n=1 Tax=Puccinia graminis f. sp. tritici TaxID=56615 RepID=A0A5B0PH76_PUCGR|nr:hypothetical protein PGT21_003267 [Puccinia graminis f. sp. tritici]
MEVPCHRLTANAGQRNTASVDQSNLIGTDSDNHINALAYSELDASLSEVWEHRTSPASSAS